MLLGNNSVITFPLEPTHATIARLLLGSGAVNTPKTIQDNKNGDFFGVLPEDI